MRLLGGVCASWQLAFNTCPHDEQCIQRTAGHHTSHDPTYKLHYIYIQLRNYNGI